MELKNRSFQYGKHRLAYILHEVLRASPAYLVHFLKICHGLGHRVDTWNYRTDFIETGVKINGAYYRDFLLGQHLLPAIRSVAGDLFTFQ